MELIREILGLPLTDERRARYNANSINKRISEVIIDGNVITGYKAFSFVREKTYVKSPERSTDGTIGNLDGYATFTTAHFKIDFSLLSIDSYRTIMNLIYQKNEFVVQCYDVVRDERVTERMYFTTEEMPKLATITRAIQGQFDNAIELIGVMDYSVEMVGTNVPVDSIKINYYDLGGSILGSFEEVENTEILIGSGVSVPTISGYAFDNAWERGYYDTNNQWVALETQQYLNGVAYRVVLNRASEFNTKTITFRAKYKDTAFHRLTFAYGLGEAVTDYYGNPISGIDFITGETVESALKRASITLNNQMQLTDLPKSPIPTVEVDGKLTETHYYNGWFLAPSKEATPVTKATVLDFGNDIVIYQVFTPRSFTIEYWVDKKEDHETLATYGQQAYLYAPRKSGYVFVGWCQKPDLSDTPIKILSSMPAQKVILYAKFEEIK